MPVTSSARTRAGSKEQGRLALAVADANWFTTENLFREAPAERADTLLLRCIDYRNALQRGLPPWAWGRSLSPSHSAAHVWERDLVLPSGWMKRYPRVGMRPIARAISDWRSKLSGTGQLALVMTYPHYLYLRDLIAPDLLVYYNVDDYTQYWPRDAERLNELENLAVREADLTVCVSHVRAEILRSAAPSMCDRIRHLPHGAPSVTLPDAPQHRPAAPPADLAHLPRPILGYVGTLEDRLDWALLDRLSAAFPDASVVLVGRLGPSPQAAWAKDRARCLARPNVHAVGWRDQGAIAAYTRAFDVCLIPYHVEHPFNRVCCPTKIMDYMATGRPVVSTALPECLLYRGLFDVVPDADAFLEATASVLARGSDDGRAAARLACAREHSCRRVVDCLLNWISA